LKGSPMKRAKQRGLTRNAVVVLGNLGDEIDAQFLSQVRPHSDPIVQEHIDWALNSITSRAPEPEEARIRIDSETA
jgi:epoxyqueuosine reductase